MRSRSVTAAILVCAVPVALWLAWLATVGAIGYEPPLLGPGVASATGYAWRGAVHVHTALSADATGSVDDIAAAAARVGLDFVVLSEHTTALGSAGRARPGWYGPVLVLVGEEISTLDGHLLALGVAPHPYALGPQARQAVDDIRALGGTAWVAHIGGDAAWTTGLGGISGIEVVSLSEALDGLSVSSRLAAAMAYPVSRPAAALRALADRPPALDLWSKRTSLSASTLPRPLVAVGAVDAHGPVVLGVPSHEVVLGSLTTVVWMDAPPTPGAADRAVAGRLLRRLRGGRVAVELSAAGRAPGLSFVATSADGRTGFPGETRRWGDGAWTVEARLGAPGDYRIELLRDGELAGAAEGGALTLEAPGPGTYRIEVYRTAGPPGGGRSGASPWILSNPIYLWPEAAIMASNVRPAPPLPAPPAARLLLSEPGWAAQSDALSASAMAPTADGLLWNIRVPNEEAAGAFSAVAWRPEGARDWRHTLGVTARLSSTQEWRVGFRVWTATAAGEQTWELVVPSKPDATAMLSPWQRFRRIGADGQVMGDERLDDELAQVTGVAFVATPQRMRPGSEAQIEIRGVGLVGSQLDG